MAEILHRYTIITPQHAQYGLFNPPENLRNILLQPYVAGANEYQDLMYIIGICLGTAGPDNIHGKPEGTVSFFTQKSYNQLTRIMAQLQTYLLQAFEYELHHVRSIRFDNEIIAPLYEDDMQVIYAREPYFAEVEKFIKKAKMDTNAALREYSKPSIKLQEVKKMDLRPMHIMGTSVKSDGKGGHEYWLRVPKEQYDTVGEELRCQERVYRDVTREDVMRFIASMPVGAINNAFFQNRLDEPIGNLIDQVAEEASELIQAVITFKRAAGLSAGTTKMVAEAREHIVEEFADVVGCMETLRHSLEANGFPDTDEDTFNEQFQNWIVYKRARALMRYYGYGEKFITDGESGDKDGAT